MVPLKSNSTASAVQVKANLLEQLRDHLNFRQEWTFNTLGRSRFESLLTHVAPEWLLTTMRGSWFKSFNIKKLVKVTECNFRDYTIKWQISNSTNVFKKILC